MPRNDEKNMNILVCFLKYIHHTKGKLDTINGAATWQIGYWST